MQIQRPPFTVTLRQKGPLGYTFKDFGSGAEVRAVKAGSQAEAAGQVVVGCTLVQIEAGGTVDHVETAPYEEVLAVLMLDDAGAGNDYSDCFCGGNVVAVCWLLLL